MGMDWPTRQSLYCKAILDSARMRGCSLIYSFAVCLNIVELLHRAIARQELRWASSMVGESVTYAALKAAAWRHRPGGAVIR